METVRVFINNITQYIWRRCRVFDQDRRLNTVLTLSTSDYVRMKNVWTIFFIFMLWREKENVWYIDLTFKRIHMKRGTSHVWVRIWRTIWSHEKRELIYKYWLFFFLETTKQEDNYPNLELPCIQILNLIQIYYHYFDTTLNLKIAYIY